MKKFKIILILNLLFLVFIVASFFAYKYHINQNAKRLYSQGVEFYNKEDYSNAFYNFKQIKKYSDFYTLSLLKQYKCAINLDDKKTALITLQKLIKVNRNDKIKPFILYNEALLSQELNSNSPIHSLKKYKYILKNYPNNDFYYASAYKVALLTKDNDKLGAKENFIKYLKYAPNGKYSISTLEFIKEYDKYFSLEDKEIVADSYFANSNYDLALKYYLKTDFSKNWIKIAKCYKALKKYDDEKEIILQGFELKNSEVPEKDISSMVDRLIAILKLNKVEALQQLYNQYQDSYTFPTIAYKLAENSQEPRNIKIYEYIVKNYPNSIWASNSLWEILWYNYKMQRYSNCISLANKHNKNYSKAQDAPRVLYWQAKAYLKLKKNGTAREIFHSIIKQYPLSYYAYLSTRALKASKSSKMIIKKPIASYDINSINKYLFEDKTLLYLAQENDWELIEELKIDDELIKSWILRKKGNYPQSINIAKKKYFEKFENSQDDLDEEDELKIKFSDKELKLIYPVLYEDEINKIALKYDNSPYLFMSLIKEESHFNKLAKSSVGAIGLTQLMPATASFIENKQVSNEELLEDNIEIGMKYFNYLINQFNGNRYLAILAYNAGPGNINKWLKNNEIASNEIDVFIENVPYLETKNYIKKILSTYWIYINVYR